MPVFKVSVKWGKEKFDLEADNDDAPSLFKAQLFALSNVPPERQKIMVKGTTLKDESWGNVKLKNGLTLLMMGSADALPEAPADKPVFMEDMTESQLASHMDLPFGLQNLGNTCYMNATIQCLRSIPELKSALLKYQTAMDANPMAMAMAAGQDMSELITTEMRNLVAQLETASAPVVPLMFLDRLFMAFPHFSEKSEHGGYTQQDANECWVQLVRMLQQRLTGSQGKVVDQFMGGRFEQTLKCIEAEDEAPTTAVENWYQLSCFIDKDVRYMQSGLQQRLKEHLTKNSPTLERDAQYEKTSKISRLPAYLCVQFVRFFYKEKEAVNAKILKDVKFQLQLDVFDLCSPDLQQKLMPMRAKFKESEDKKLEAAADGKKVEKKKKKDDKEVKTLPFSFEDDVGSNNSGYYDLHAILTHKGRSSSSGHYVAWVRKSEEKWIMYDDDRVTIVESEDVLKLSGGGDWHSAYVLVYAPRKFEVEDDS